MGFKIEDDLNTPHSRALWLDWKRRIDPSHYLDPKKRAAAGRRAPRKCWLRVCSDLKAFTARSIAMGLNAQGEICGVTTTSGLSWKIPGRVGDSPILGAGLYVDGNVGGRLVRRAGAKQTSMVSGSVLSR